MVSRRRRRRREAETRRADAAQQRGTSNRVRSCVAATVRGHRFLTSHRCCFLCCCLFLSRSFLSDDQEGLRAPQSHRRRKGGSHQEARGCQSSTKEGEQGVQIEQESEQERLEGMNKNTGTQGRTGEWVRCSRLDLLRRYFVAHCSTCTQKCPQRHRQRYEIELDREQQAHFRPESRFSNSKS